MPSAHPIFRGFVTPEAPSRAGSQPQDEPRRLRVLVGAYAMSPARGSEPGMGWNICRELAAHHDVTVLCSPGMPGHDPDAFRRETQAFERDNGPVSGLTAVYVDPPPLARLCQRETELYRRTVYYMGYAAWQRAAYRAAAALHARQPFDLAHHLNITGYREPGYLWKLPIPFLWGPVGGAADIPQAFFPLMSTADRVFYRIRNFSNGLQKRLSRRCRSAAKKASLIWAIGVENDRMIREIWGCEAEKLLESGTVPRRQVAPRHRVPGRPLRLVWSGLHIGRKALPILLHALHRLHPDGSSGAANVEVTVLGTGPETLRWQKLAWALGVAPLVRWTGRLPLDEALAEVAGADAMIFTSVQEGTPHVVLEALSLGLPVVCHDACGMGAAVTADCGIKIPMCSPELSIGHFADAIRNLADGTTDLARLSTGALRRSAELNWTDKARIIARAYGRVIDASAASALQSKTVVGL